MQYQSQFRPSESFHSIGKFMHVSDIVCTQRCASRSVVSNSNNSAGYSKWLNIDIVMKGGKFDEGYEILLEYIMYVSWKRKKRDSKKYFWRGLTLRNTYVTWTMDMDMEQNNFRFQIYIYVPVHVTCMS